MTQGDRKQSKADEHLRCLAQHRGLLRAIGYRMLGTASDLEDLLQECYLQFAQTPWERIENPRALLVTIFTRLTIDYRKSARMRRETYVGEWLPEPIINEFDDPAREFEQEETLRFAFLLVLEKLSPVERAVFLLRDVFDFEYSEIGKTIERNPVATRKIAERARKRVREERADERRLEVRHDESELALHFFKAIREGAVEPLAALLSQHARLQSDGGGKVSAAINPISGPTKIARFFLGLTEKFPDYLNLLIQPARINGSRAFVFYRDGSIENVLIFVESKRGIETVFAVRNPDKLKGLARQLERIPRFTRWWWRFWFRLQLVTLPLCSKTRPFVLED